MTEPHAAGALAELEAELARFEVVDVLLHAASTAATLAYRCLEPDTRDLEQVRLAVAALAVLLPLLAGRIDPDVESDFRTALAALRAGYDRAGG